METFNPHIWDFLNNMDTIDTFASDFEENAKMFILYIW